MTARPIGERRSARPKRCAIYTRIGVVEPAGRPPVSIHDQRVACLHYIRQHRGWSVLEERYDDLGKSGANMDRPALQRLLAHIAALRVDIVVVHEADRLSRWYLDFATIMERLRRADVAFVSVAHQVSTVEPTGQLTMKLLLSFAELEHAAHGERPGVAAAGPPHARHNYDAGRAGAPDRPRLVCTLQALPPEPPEGSS